MATATPTKTTTLPLPSRTGLAAAAPLCGGAQPVYQRSRSRSLARAQGQWSGDEQQRWRFTADEWANLLGSPTANDMAVEDLLGQQAFRRLFAGSTSILRTHAASNGKDPGKSAGALLWPECMTVDITTAASNTLPLRVPLWKRQEPHNLNALMVHVNYDSNAPPLDGLLAQPPVLELRGFATAETVFPADGGSIIDDRSFILFGGRRSCLSGLSTSPLCMLALLQLPPLSASRSPLHSHKW